MDLKKYQERVVEEVRAYLNLLAEKQRAGSDLPSYTAWSDLGISRPYRPRKNGLHKDLPTFCIKVPTGGGKTLLATQILGEIYRSLLRERNGAGLVLWVVPSDQIYKDTLKALRDRAHFYRESLEFALSRRIEVWEKDEIARLTPGQLASNLNILILKLQGTNREDKESLKFFRDSGGNIVQHFPPEDEPERHRKLMEDLKIPARDMVESDPATGRYLAKTSIGNLVRLCEPAVILDEGHRATSTLARQTVESFNARIVVELSATPPADANVLVKVSGNDLLEEHMIKLPLNVANSNQKNWKDVLAAAKDRRAELAKLASKHYRETGRYIRPIVLVQVERVGKDQREAGLIHSADVKEHLMQRMGVEERAIAVKTAEEDDLEKLEKEGISLLDEGCAVEWIITKAALQEGWDCPFAYILVSLSNTQSQRGMTQLVGRILRQPYQERTSYDELNECYVYCLRLKAAEITRQVKASLEKEGYEGDMASPVDRSSGEPDRDSRKTARILPRFSRHYKKPFVGRIFLPRFCVKHEDGYEALDYFRHLIGAVDVETFDYGACAAWDFSLELAAAKEQFYRITLGQAAAEKMRELEAQAAEPDTSLKAWLVANLSFGWFSAKQLWRVVNGVAAKLPAIHGRMALVKFALRERISGFIQAETDRMTQAAFVELFQDGRLCFVLECVEGRFEIPKEIAVRSTKRLNHDNGDAIAQSLFDYVPDEMNEYEKSIALYLDKHPEVLWWYRNLIGSSNFSIQGYRRNRIYPDFVIQRGDRAKDSPLPIVVVLEGKGKQLKGNFDTTYKRDVADYFGKVGRKVTWQELGRGFEHHQFRCQVLDEGDYPDRSWVANLNSILTESIP